MKSQITQQMVGLPAKTRRKLVKNSFRIHIKSTNPRAVDGWIDIGVICNYVDDVHKALVRLFGEENFKMTIGNKNDGINN